MLLLCAEVLEFGNPLYSDDPTEPDTTEAAGTTEAAAIEDTIQEATTEI